MKKKTSIMIGNLVHVTNTIFNGQTRYHDHTEVGIYPAETFAKIEKGLKELGKYSFRQYAFKDFEIVRNTNGLTANHMIIAEDRHIVRSAQLIGNFDDLLQLYKQFVHPKPIGIDGMFGSSHFKGNVFYWLDTANVVYLEELGEGRFSSAIDLFPQDSNFLKESGLEAKTITEFSFVLLKAITIDYRHEDRGK